MIVVALDPGPEESAWVVWDGARQRILDFSNAEPNPLMLKMLRSIEAVGSQRVDHCAIEQIRGFGVMASDKLFDTCWWSGRFFEAFSPDETTMVPRKMAAAHICGTGGISKDSFVREAIIARFGGKEKAIGSKKVPGPLYGIHGHAWAALAVAITWHECLRGG